MKIDWTDACAKQNNNKQTNEDPPPTKQTNKQTNNLEMKVGIFSLIECGVEGSICSSLPLLFSSVQPSTMFCQSQQTPVEPLRQCIPLKKIKIPNVCGLGCGRKTMGCLSRKVLYFSAWLSGAVWCHACFQCVRIKDSRESATENQEFFSPICLPVFGAVLQKLVVLGNLLLFVSSFYLRTQQHSKTFKCSRAFKGKLGTLYCTKLLKWQIRFSMVLSMGDQM